MTEPALVIGYGNDLRGDDGVGLAAIERLQADPRLAGCTLLARRQLTPDLVVDMASAAFVVLIDATVDAPPGTVSVTALPRTGPGATTWSHHVDPATLVGLTGELYGRVPDVMVVSIGIALTEVGAGLSPAVDASLPLIVETVAGLVAGRRVAVTHA